MQAAVEELRRQCRFQVGQGRKEDNLTEHQILTWAEQIFNEDSGTSRTAATNLADAAKVAPDLFGEAVVGAISIAASTEAFHKAALPALAELAGHRSDLTARLTASAVAALFAGVGLESVCAILSKTRPKWTSEERRPILEQVVARRSHIRPIGGWPTRDPQCDLVDIPPSYALSNAFIAQEYDRDGETVLGVVREALRADDTDRRINACGVVRGLMGLRPQVGVALAPEIAASLELVENEFGERADDEECKTLAQAFVIDPEAIDRILAGRIESRKASVQEVIIEVYTLVLRTKVSVADDDDEEPAAGNEQQAQGAIVVALRRVLQLLQDEKLDIDPLLEAVQAIHSASRHHPQALIEHYSLLFHTMATWATQPEARSSPPTILIPGTPPVHPGLAAMERQSRNMRWQQIKRELGEGMSKLVEEYPHRIADTLLGSFANLNSTTQASFKAEVVKLLGDLGKQYDLLPRVLPALWTAMMDSSSQLIRACGIEAIGECFRWASQGPPSDVVSMLVLHLNDTYVIVHRAAVRVVGDNPSWLTEEQAHEALERLDNLLGVYKSEQPFELEAIADTLLEVSRQVPRAPKLGRHAGDFSPPNRESLLDQHLIERLTRNVRPAEPAARAVARFVLEWIGRDDSDAEDYRDRMNEAFTWLHALPPALFRDIRTLVIEQARKTAGDRRRDGLLRQPVCGVRRLRGRARGVVAGTLQVAGWTPIRAGGQHHGETCKCRWSQRQPLRHGG